jgi:hypothetical protein
VHYVSQDVKLTEKSQDLTPIEIVLAADLERTLLLQELKQLEIMTQNDTLDTKGQTRYSEVVQQLDLIGAESAERRVIELLDNLG